MSVRGWVQSIYAGKPPLQVEVCCGTFLEATTGGTDNEGYGPLISIGWQEPGQWRIGSSLPAPRFCPWCGQPVAEAPEDSRPTTPP